ncbi:hypothetical protein ACHAPI_010049 [Fusarium lateritium]
MKLGERAGMAQKDLITDQKTGWYVPEGPNSQSKCNQAAMSQKELIANHGKAIGDFLEPTS